MEKQVMIKVYGLVQGVNFRYYTQKYALSLNLKGYVKNNDDGSVEIVGLGEEENLKKLIEWAKVGPPAARVEKIEVKWQKPTRKFNTFEIKY